MTKWIDGIATALTMLMSFCGGIAAAGLYPEALNSPPTAYVALMWCLGGILVVLYFVERQLAKKPTE